MTENQNTVEILLNMPRGTTTWRNNVGLCVYNKHGRRWTVKYGLCDGSSDRIGLTKITITPEMIGRTMGIFTAIEIKTETGSRRKKQKHFIEFLKNAGCIALFATNSEDVKRAIDEFKTRG